MVPCDVDKDLDTVRDGKKGRGSRKGTCDGILRSRFDAETLCRREGDSDSR